MPNNNPHGHNQYTKPELRSQKSKKPAPQPNQSGSTDAPGGRNTTHESDNGNSAGSDQPTATGGTQTSGMHTANVPHLPVSQGAPPPSVSGASTSTSTQDAEQCAGRPARAERRAAALPPWMPPCSGRSPARAGTARGARTTQATLPTIARRRARLAARAARLTGIAELGRPVHGRRGAPIRPASGIPAAHPLPVRACRSVPALRWPAAPAAPPAPSRGTRARLTAA